MTVCVCVCVCVCARVRVCVYVCVCVYESHRHIVHPGIDAVFTYFFKKSTVWRPCDLELPNFGQVITTHMASFLTGSFPWKQL